MGRTSKNIKLRIPEKPCKIKGFRTGGYPIATTISSESLLSSPTQTPFEETAKTISDFKIIYPEDDYTHPIHYKSIALEFRTELLANGISMKMSSDMIDAENGLDESK